jgi:pimeloyl-ACP methyl ester carboxylesterase
MPRARANGIEIEYEFFGDTGADPLLLIMGLGGQMTMWEEGFCRGLAERGYRVIRYDNRDVGLSTRFDHAGLPDIPALMAAQASGQTAEVAYTMDDMADDAAGLLDVLEIDRAHVVGASMGGMIAQTVAIRHPARVRSLVSIMSSTGNPELPPAKPEVMAQFMAPVPTDREGSIERSVQMRLLIGSPGFPTDEATARERAGRAYDRAFTPDGTARQMAAIMTHGNRKPDLASVTAPTLVIHGAADPLVPPAGGHDTADAIPGAELLMIEGMGHDLPEALWGRLTDAIAGHADKARS